MKRRDIGFRELLEKVLPVEALPPADRLLVQRALANGIDAELQHTAFLALEQLEGSGALRRLPAPPGSGEGVMRYQPRDAFELITLHLPAPERADGVRICPRSTLPSRAQTGLHQLRELLRLDDPVAGDPLDGSAQTTVRDRLREAGRGLLPESTLGFHDAVAPEGAAACLDAGLAADAIAQPGALLYAPDAWTRSRLEPAARRRGVRSVVVAAVRGRDGAVLGCLEAAHPAAHAYTPEDLARIALLSDFCGALLERAQRIEKLVFVDPHTTVYNRSYFDLQAQNELARAERESGSVALCIADIDDFKMFNTLFGYEAGNRVLVEVAQALKRGVRPFDTVARWGGEEFAVLLTSPVQSADARTISERLRTAVERLDLTLEALDGRTRRVRVTISIGVALFPDHAASAPDLWRAANQALLAAKTPKNQVVFYREGDAGA
ncbi:MAG: GGDEF domain-containing protein [Candidatus Eisenbacteria bacterium]|nr:GGDEF domain-containing protein [Candidatus Eisenbacteria bacterium]